MIVGILLAGGIGQRMGASVPKQFLEVNGRPIICYPLEIMEKHPQIDAIEVLKVNPIRYLFVPRVLAGILMMPVVVAIASVVGVFTGAVTSNLVSGLTYRAFFDSAWFGIYMKDLCVCLLKAMSFGGVIAHISCSCGYEAKGGAKGVGDATTKAVVWSFIAIVILDMFFAIAFFF